MSAHALSSHWTDEELTELYRRYGYVLRRRCKMLLRSDAAADDAVQDAFVKFLGAKEAFTLAENPVAWMYRVVDRCCFDQLRRAKVRQTESLDDHENDASPHPDIDVEARELLLKILHELSDVEYEIAVMTYVDGMNQVDIAAALGLSRPTIWKRLSQMRERAMGLLGGST